MTREAFLQASPDELLRAFDRGRFPQRPEGDYEGWLVATLAGRMLRMQWLMRMIWRGKRIEPGRIFNRVLGRWGVPGTLSEDGSRVDGRASLVIQYAAPPILRPLRDEMRELDPDTLLGVVHYGPWLAGFFLLRRSG